MYAAITYAPFWLRHFKYTPSGKAFQAETGTKNKELGRFSADHPICHRKTGAGRVGLTPGVYTHSGIRETVVSAEAVASKTAGVARGKPSVDAPYKILGNSRLKFRFHSNQASLP